MRKISQLPQDPAGQVSGNVYLFKALAGTRDAYPPTENLREVAGTPQAESTRATPIQPKLWRWPLGRLPVDDAYFAPPTVSISMAANESGAPGDDTIPSFLMRGKVEAAVETETATVATTVFAAVCAELREGRHVCRDAVKQVIVLCRRHSIGLCGVAGIVAGLVIAGTEFDLRTGRAMAAPVDTLRKTDSTINSKALATAPPQSSSQLQQVRMASLEAHSQHEVAGLPAAAASQPVIKDVHPVVLVRSRDLMRSSTQEASIATLSDQLGNHELAALPGPMSVLTPVQDVPVAPPVTTAVYATLATEGAEAAATRAPVAEPPAAATSAVSVEAENVRDRAVIRRTYPAKARVERSARMVHRILRPKRSQVVSRQNPKPAAAIRIAKPAVKAASGQGGGQGPQKRKAAHRSRAKPASGGLEPSTPKPIVAVRTLDEAMTRQYGSPN